ncbi:MAG TPA: hypothetical protein VK625_00175 [Flavitalea sp.]|nr:hypothetical protein [Flavitalea sp.]
MKKYRLFLYNFGSITQIADFKTCFTEGSQCMRALNKNLFEVYGNTLPDNTFYWASYDLVNDRTRSLNNITIECKEATFENIDSIVAKQWDKLKAFIQPKTTA